MGRVFTNGPEDLGSIPGRVIQKTLKMVLDTSLLNTQEYKVHIKGKVEWSNPGKGVVPSPTPQCSSYGKGSLLVALEYDPQLYYILKNGIEFLHIPFGSMIKFQFLAQFPLDLLEAT